MLEDLVHGSWNIPSSEGLLTPNLPGKGTRTNKLEVGDSHFTREPGSIMRDVGILSRSHIWEQSASLSQSWSDESWTTGAGLTIFKKI